MGQRITMARADLLNLVEATLKDYRGLLTRHTTEARPILRELLVDRVLYTPKSSKRGRLCEFTAQCSLGKILQGTLDPNGGGPNGIRTRVSVTTGGPAYLSVTGLAGPEELRHRASDTSVSLP